MEFKSRIDLTDIIAYLTIAAAGAGGLLGIPSTFQRWIVFGMLVALGVLRARFWFTEWHKKETAAYIYMIVSLALIVVLLFFTPNSFYVPIMFFVWSVDVMLLFPLRIAALWIAAFSLVVGVYFVLSFGWLEGMRVLLPYSTGYFFFGVFSNSLVRAQAAQAQSQKLLEELRSAHEQLQAYAARVETLAVSQERNRMAREMHDTLGHRLTVASVQLEGAQRLLRENPAKAADMLTTVRTQIKEALKDVRQTVSKLREPLEAELPLPQAVRQAALSFQEATGLSVHLDVGVHVPVLSAEQHLAMYRAVQEALTNVQRHAQATQVWLSLFMQADELCLHVRDNGAGLADESANARRGFGLLGMNERAVQLGGHFSMENWQTSGGQIGGASLTFCLPVPHKEEIG